jgi:hypothetical protein
MLKSLVMPVLLAAVITVSAFGEGPGPVSVSIAAPASAVIAVADQTMSVSGTAAGGAGITRVTWQTSDGATGVATGASNWVATGIPVLTATTTIVIRACDSKGASNWVAVVAVRP